MQCPYCGNAAEWVSNAAIYGRTYGKSYMVYLCRPCNAYVGCHNNTTKPLGTMANAELREWRVKAHNHIDPLWQSGEMKRSDVYAWLNRHFGKDIHIGESDVETCRKILSLNNQEAKNDKS